MGMMGKLKATQQRIEETKKRMDTILIDEQIADGQLKVTLTANSKVKSVEISDSLLEDKDQLEDYFIVVMNKALEKAAKVNQGAGAEVLSIRDVVCLSDFRKRHRRDIGDKSNHIKVGPMAPKNTSGLVIDGILIVT